MFSLNLTVNSRVCLLDVVLSRFYQRFLAQKKGTYFLYKCLIIKVENIGVEPMTSCMPCKRSSQLS